MSDSFNEVDFILKDLAVSWDTSTSLIETYRKSLGDYVEFCAREGITDTHKKYALNKLEECWVRKLGFSKSVILEDIRELIAPKMDLVNSLTLKGALNYPNLGSSWIIPNLLRSTGLYVLGGEAKVGKTILMNLLMKGVAVTGEFLEYPVKTGNVLYIQLEESLPLLAERLYLSGFGDVIDPEMSLVVNFLDRIRIERDFDLTTGLDWLTKLILEYKPVLTIIDSLRMATINSPHSENSNEHGKSVYALQRVFNYTNTCGILIHHMSKLGNRNRDNVSLVEMFAGHASISAASDGLLGLFSIDTPSGKAIRLKTLPRQGTTVTIDYQVAVEDGLWKLNKLADSTPSKNPITSQILRLLGNNIDTYFTEKNILKELDMDVSTPLFKSCLGYLEASQIINKIYKDKKFSYGLTSESAWVVNPVDLTSLVSQTVLDANLLITCTTKTKLREVVDSWEKEYQKEVIESLLEDEFYKLNKLVHSSEYVEGDLVEYDNQVAEVLQVLTEAPSLYTCEYLIQLPKGEEIQVKETELLAYEESKEVELDVTSEEVIDRLESMYNSVDVPVYSVDGGDEEGYETY